MDERALADEYLPVFDVVMRHECAVAAPATVVWEALHRADLGGASIVRALLALRGLRRPGNVRRLTLDRLIDGGFAPLGERPGREVALGLVGRFWRPSGGRVRLGPAEFAGFARPGYARAVWTFSVVATGPATARLATETRVACVDAAARRHFRLYWLVVRPFSGLIRRAMLHAVAREAEGARV
ncbi:MAG TPA: hypothetical protein VGR82_10435 [Methylomirabilota bacterium]|jgi:hypothetical protein|nr:hypothetical protein [Methylomirabilota bacterium]